MMRILTIGITHNRTDHFNQKHTIFQFFLLQKIYMISLNSIKELKTI